MRVNGSILQATDQHRAVRQKRNNIADVLPATSFRFGFIFYLHSEVLAMRAKQTTTSDDGTKYELQDDRTLRKIEIGTRRPPKISACNSIEDRSLTWNEQHDLAQTVNVMIKFLFGPSLQLSLVGMSLLGLLLAGSRPGIALPTRPVIVSQTTAESYFQQGEKRYWEDDFQGAIADYTQVIRLNPNFASAYINRGLCRFQLKDFQGAIADYTQAIRLNPNFAYAYLDRGHARSQLKDFQGTIADYTQVLRINPDFARAYARRGDAYYWLANYQRALSDSDKALALRTRNSGTPENAAFIAGLVQRRLQPDNFIDTAYAIRGAAQIGLKDYRAAQADLDEGVTWSSAMGDDGNGFALYFRGLLQLRQGNYQAAISDYQKALEKTPWLRQSKLYEDYSLIARQRLNKQ
jgi:tetratricopeptide (TPR) repeat protein